MAIVSQQMKNLGRVIGVYGVLMFSPPVASAEFDRGQALYENHCKSCHEDWAHTREGRRVASMSALRQRVAGWSFHSGLDWGNEEIDDVTDYLNRNFYQLTDQP